MINLAYSEILCNAIYKRLLDIYNNEEDRALMLEIFKSSFKHAYLSMYDDLIVAIELCEQVIFISDKGIFRYYNEESERYITLDEYERNEYILFAITINMYQNDMNDSYIPDALKYKLEALTLYSLDNIEAIKNDLNIQGIDTELIKGIEDQVSLYSSNMALYKKVTNSSFN